MERAVSINCQNVFENPYGRVTVSFGSYRKSMSDAILISKIFENSSKPTLIKIDQRRLDEQMFISHLSLLTLSHFSIFNFYSPSFYGSFVILYCSHIASLFLIFLAAYHYYSLHTALHSVLLFLTAYFLLLTSHSSLLTVHSSLLTFYFSLFTAHFSLHTAHLSLFSA